jgi:parvulin-like peptidyl-prolyl isomerase
MKKFMLVGLIAGSLFAFPGMAGGSMSGHAGMMGKPMKGLKDNTILAKLNGKPIRVKEINAYLQGITGDYRIRLQDLPAQHVKEFVQQYLKMKEIYNSRAKAITKAPQYKAAAEKLAVDMWLNDRLNKTKISEYEIKKFYNENKDLYFKSEPKFKARHIVVKDETLARKLIKELKGLRGKSLESKFAKLAKKYSTGPSKVQGGELGWFDPNQMVPEFSKACANLSEGEITLEPVKTRFGYHIILLEGKDSKNYIPLAKVKRQIIEYLKREKLQKELKRIKNSYKVKYLIPKN